MAWRMETYTHELELDAYLLHLANEHEYQMCNDYRPFTLQLKYTSLGHKLIMFVSLVVVRWFFTVPWSLWLEATRVCMDLQFYRCSALCTACSEVS